MSSASKVTLVLSCVASGGIIAYVCIRQQYDRYKLRESVWRDVEKQQRKTENIYMLQQQADLTKRLRLAEEMRKESGVSNG